MVKCIVQLCIAICTIELCKIVHEYQKVGKGGKVAASGSATVVKAWRIVGKKVRTLR